MEGEKKQVSFVKIGIWYLICDVFLKAISFLTAPFFNRILSPAEVGNYSNIVSWASLLSIIVTLDLSSSIANAKYDYEGKKLNRFISSILILGTIVSSIFLVVFFFYGELFSDLLNIEYKYLLIMLISFTVSPALSITLYKLRFQMQYKKVIFITVLSTLASVITPVILVNLLPNKLDGRFFGHYIPSIIVSFILYVILIIKGKSFSKEHISYALAISIPMAVHAISGSVLSSFDRIMITDLCGATDNALYSNAYIFGTLLLLVWHSFNSAWVPWCFDKLNQEDFDGVKKYSRIVLIPFALMMVLATLLAPEGLFILGGSYYVEAKYVVPPVMAGCAATIVYTFFVNIEHFYKKQRFIAIGTIVSAIINILLNYLFIPEFGYIAAAYTTFASYIFLLLFHYLICKAYLKKTWIYDSKFLAFFLLIVIGILGFCLVLYTNDVIRYLFIGVISIVLIVVILVYRKTIISILRK